MHMLAVPLVATLLTLVDGWHLARAATVVAGIISLILTVAIALSVAHGQAIVAAGGWMQVDSLGAVFLLATGLLYAIAGIFSIGYLALDEGHADAPGFAKRYFAYLNLFGWTMLLVPVAADFGTLWVAVELTTIVSALLVAIDRTDAALEASWKYILIASSGLGIALLAIVLYATGTHLLGSAYVPRFERYFHQAHGLSREAVALAFVLSVVGFGTKVGFVPMHTWLPDAHSEAPAPVSAMLSGSLLSAALYAILRFFQVTVASGQRSFAEHVLIVFGAISLAAAALFVVRQHHYKRLLAYSSIEHMGIIALGIGFGAPLAVVGALLHVLTHAAAKGLAFFGAGSLLRGYDTKEVDGITGALRAMPWTASKFFAADLALCGLPPRASFAATEIVAAVCEVAVRGCHPAAGGVNLAFFGVAWHAARMVLSPSGDGGADGSGGASVAVTEGSRWMLAGMAGCLFVSIALGVHLPGQLSSLLTSAMHRLAGPA